MPIDDKTPTWRHQLVIIDRENMTIGGVVNVGRFDDHEIIVGTERGVLAVKGDNLNIQSLNLEEGNMVIEGSIQSAVYEEEGKNKRGLLDRLFK